MLQSVQTDVWQQVACLMPRKVAEPFLTAEQRQDMHAKRAKITEQTVSSPLAPNININVNKKKTGQHMVQILGSLAAVSEAASPDTFVQSDDYTNVLVCAIIVLSIIVLMLVKERFKMKKQMRLLTASSEKTRQAKTIK